jgi:hypothetical protein
LPGHFPRQSNIHRQNFHGFLCNPITCVSDGLCAS